MYVFDCKAYIAYVTNCNFPKGYIFILLKKLVLLKGNDQTTNFHTI